MLNVESSLKRRKSKTLTADNNSRNGVNSRRPSMDVVKDVSTKSDEAVLFDNYQHIIYEKAAIIYAYLKGEANAVLPMFEDERVKRRAYSLAFGAKKCKKIPDTYICCLARLCILKGILYSLRVNENI